MNPSGDDDVLLGDPQRRAGQVDPRRLAAIGLGLVAIAIALGILLM
jgi:hypothetical protein